MTFLFLRVGISDPALTTKLNDYVDMIIKNLQRGEIEIEDASLRLHGITLIDESVWKIIFAAVFNCIPEFGDILLQQLDPIERYLQYLPDEPSASSGTLRYPSCDLDSQEFHEISSGSSLTIIGKGHNKKYSYRTTD